MASKKPKAELVAICKLEFYRKQKNWRYCPPERKGRDPKRRTKTTNTKDSKAKLNQTYNIPRAPEALEASEKQEPSGLDIQETEERHILDEAFVDTETGTESDEAVQQEGQESNALEDVADKPSSQPDPPGSPYSPKWSIQRWAERRGLWNPEPTPTSDPIYPTHDPIYPTHDAICPTHEPTCPTHEPTGPTYPTTPPTLDPFRLIHNPSFPQQTSQEDANCPTFDNNYNIIQDVYYSSQYLNLPHKGTDYYANYPPQSCDTKYVQETLDPEFGVSMVYYNSNMHHQDLNVAQSGTGLLDVGMVCEWLADDWEKCAGEGAVWSDAAWLQEAAAVGASGEDAVDGDWQLHDLSDVSQCSSVPSVASSEFIRGAVLAPHSTQIDLLVGPEAPARLPAGELAAAVARHSAALRELLAEAQRRDQMPAEPPQPLASLYSFDEVPVRDPGPALLPPAAVYNDRIVARSRPAPDLRGHTGTAGHIGSAGHDGGAGHSGSVGHSETGAGQTEVGRGRGRLNKVGIRMGRPYRL